MLKNLLFNLYDLSEILYYNYNNVEISNNILAIEKENYSKFSINSLVQIQNIVEYILNKYDIDNKENFELIFEEDEVLIFKRIYNQIKKSINNYHKDYLFVDLYDVVNGKLKFIDNIGGSINILEEEMICNIETKFLYFLIDDKSLTNEYKSEVLLKLLYVNPYLDEKLQDHKKTIIEYLLKEDEYYNNLSDLNKKVYDSNIVEYSLNVLKDIFYKLLTNKYLEEDELKIYELYIRSLFNNLDENTLEQLNYNFNEMNVNIINKDGEEAIRRAFKSIKKDRENIKKLKI